MGTPIRVLIIEDSEDDVLLAVRALKKGSYDPVFARVEDAGTMRKALQEKTWDVILCDYKMPKFNGLAAIALLKETGIDIPLIIVSGAIGEETAVACMKAGANDYVMKGNLSRLVPAIERELIEAESRSKRRQAEKALQESNALIEAVVENIPLMIFLKESTELRFVMLNRAGEELLGYDREGLLGRNNLDLFPPEQAAHFMAKDREVLDGEADMLDIPEEPILMAKKGQRLLHTRKVRVRGTDGETKYLLGISEDITEHKRAEWLLRDSEEKFRKAFQTSPDSININRLEDGMYISINLGFTRITGYTEAEIIGKTSIEYNIWNNIEDRERLVAGLRKDGEVINLDAAFRMKDGDIRYGLMSASVIDLNGIPHILSITRDITDRKRAEKELKESEQRFMDVLYSSSDAVLLIDGEQFVDCNEATARMLGYANRDNFMQTHPSELSPPTQPDGRNSLEKANEMMRIASERGFHQFEWVHRRANGEDFTVEVSLTSIVLHGKNVIHCMWRDLTERKQKEEELQRTFERLRRAINATIQVMVSAIEVRDPYTSGHQIRSANLARVIATEMELPPNVIDGIRMAGSVHDIGKLSIPAEILSKPTKLTNIEFSLIKEHSRSGYEILKDVESPWPLAEIAYQHHERMDGSGYPRNLRGGEILMEARILAVADVVEAMASHRPYRPSLGIDVALEEIENNKGTIYDADVVDACLRLFREKGFQLEKA
jgi:PAS domain S-box-containing protein